MFHKKISFPAIFPVIFFLCCPDLYADQVVISSYTDKEPVVDGRIDENIWNTAESVSTFDPIAGVLLTLRSVYSDGSIFFLVEFADDTESRNHKSWIWNPLTKKYYQGPDREDVIVLKFGMSGNVYDLSVFADKPYVADIWYWKACRSDPVGYADDKIQCLLAQSVDDAHPVRSFAGRDMFLQRKGDAGTSTYKTQIYVENIGEVLQRYKHRQPQASRGDIKAKGLWKDKRWTMEFGRSLVTGNDDDLNFSDLNKEYMFGISRYEIAGRAPETGTDVPLFGSGDITEMLTLRFQEK